MVAKVVVPEFTPRSGIRIDVTDAEANARANEGSLGKLDTVFLILKGQHLDFWATFHDFHA